MTDRKFKTGDEVELTSGSPTMSVREYVTDTEVQCDWHNGKDFVQKTFKEDQLVKYVHDPMGGLIL
jgi:uncharacterized protein YodC (DUF2158 family)